MRRICFLAATCVIFLLAPQARAQDAGPLLARIKAVGKEGAGNAEAAKAWKALVKLGPGALPDILAGLDDASPTAANWIRAAVEQIRDDAQAAGKPLPADRLEAFVKETKHAGHGRRLAYELLVRVDPTAPGRLLPGMLDDPGAELRRDAVALILKDAEALATKKADGAMDGLKKVLKHARDRDQVEAAAKHLKALGVTIDLTAHYGFITNWLVIGPFDNRKGVGFHDKQPPQSGLDPKAVYVGKDKEEIRWQPHVTPADKMGLVNFNKIYTEKKGVVGFAYSVVESATERPVELRAASSNAVRIYLNGKEIFFREEYHHGMEIDQHVGKGVLKAGRNEILVKVCQNEQTDDWAREWSFQLRVCDAIGGAVPVTVVTGKVQPAGGE
jgi:hypothetical protein